MKQIVFPSKNVISVEEGKAEPVPTASQVKISVKASGINFADILMRVGLYPDAPPLPASAGYEVSGIVSEIGSAVDPKWLGKSVIAATHFSGYSSVVVTDIKCCIEKPEHLSFVEAASIPVVYITAWMILWHIGGLRKNQTGGGVGLAAIDIVRHVGGISFGTASKSKHEFLKSRGLDHAIDYRSQDFEKEILRLTNGKGVDIIMDPIGGGESWKKNYRILRKGGRLCFFGASTLKEIFNQNSFPVALAKVIWTLFVPYASPSWKPLQLMNDNKAVFGVNVGKMFDDELDVMHEWLEIIVQGINEGWVRPHIDSVFSFDNIKQAHQYIEDRKNIGKVEMLTLGDIGSP